MKASEVFSKVKDIDKILRDLATFKIEITCKGMSEALFKIQILNQDGNKLVIHQTDGIGKIEPAGNVIGAFSLGGEKYFFQADLRSNNKSLYFDKADLALFHLQRRQNYRIKIPQSYKAVVVMNGHLPGKPCQAQLLDLSGGGCRISLPAIVAAPGLQQQIHLSIQLANREAFSCTALVKHIQEDPQGKKGKWIGLQFSPITPILESKLFAITLDLHRELFKNIS